MLIGCVVGDEIENELEPALMGFVEQAVEILQSSKHWIDTAIIGNVVTEILHR